MDKKKKAVALKYDPGSVAPEVVAKGSGHIAEKILEKALENETPVYEDKALVEELTKIDIGENIPPELYEVVAKILLFIGDLDKLQGKKIK
ncbi:MAG: EscU/YscU/HrcU family type III secretion system export apparatus switch protein [Lachnospirales bacterium]